MQLKLAVASDAAVIGTPPPVQRNSRVKVQSAVYPDARQRLAVGPDHMALDRTAWLECKADFRVRFDRFLIAGEERVIVDRRPACRPAQKPMLVKFAKNVVVRRPVHNDIAPARLRSEDERAVGRRFRRPIQSAIIRRIRRNKLQKGAWHGPVRRKFSDSATD